MLLRSSEKNGKWNYIFSRGIACCFFANRFVGYMNIKVVTIQYYDRILETRVVEIVLVARLFTFYITPDPIILYVTTNQFR